MTGLLASVRNTHEARLALAGGADIIDCKNPHQGALGALPPAEIRRIVDRIGSAVPVSAAVGDTCDPEQLPAAVQAIHAAGVDYIKFGLFNEPHADRCLRALAPFAHRVRLIAVCFADRFDPEPLLPKITEHGLYGVMIDTADKAAGRLTELWSAARRERFVHGARQLNLLCGLAGKLQRQDIPQLLPHDADYLGFRSALCGGRREAELQPDALASIRNSIPGQGHADTRATAG
jgi:dihydroneopterin aldolase